MVPPRPGPPPRGRRARREAPRARGSRSCRRALRGGRGHRRPAERATPETAGGAVGGRARATQLRAAPDARRHTGRAPSAGRSGQAGRDTDGRGAPDGEGAGLALRRRPPPRPRMVAVAGVPGLLPRRGDRRCRGGHALLPARPRCRSRRSGAGGRRRWRQSADGPVAPGQCRRLPAFRPRRVDLRGVVTAARRRPAHRPPRRRRRARGGRASLRGLWPPGVLETSSW